jgi:hypothetical protein
MRCPAAARLVAFGIHTRPDPSTAMGQNPIHIKFGPLSLTLCHAETGRLNVSKEPSQ